MSVIDFREPVKLIVECPVGIYRDRDYIAFGLTRHSIIYFGVPTAYTTADKNVAELLFNVGQTAVRLLVLIARVDLRTRRSEAFYGSKAHFHPI